VLWLDAATFAVSAAAVAVAVPSHVRTEDRSGGGYIAELVEGLRFVRRDRIIFSIVIAAVVLNFLVEPVFVVVIRPTHKVRALPNFR